MSINYNGKKFYNTTEVCKATGISQATFFRLLKQGITKTAMTREGRSGMFTEEEVRILKSIVKRMKLSTQIDLFVK